MFKCDQELEDLLSLRDGAIIRFERHSRHEAAEFHSFLCSLLPNIEFQVEPEGPLNDFESIYYVTGVLKPE